LTSFNLENLCKTALSNDSTKRFAGKVLLNHIWFSSLEEERQEMQRWLGLYNTQRPHHSLGNLTPVDHLSPFAWY